MFRLATVTGCCVSAGCFFLIVSTGCFSGCCVFSSVVSDYFVFGIHDYGRGLALILEARLALRLVTNTRFITQLLP